MRLFVALDIPESVRGELRRRLDRLRAELPRARWVDPAVVHLTLAFLGEVEGARRQALDAALGPVFARSPALELGLEGGGAFPPGRPARVVWVGLRADSGLLPLQRSVAQAAAGAAQVAPEERDYHPHVTLARCDPPWSAEAVERCTRAFAAPVGERFVAREGVLFQSHLGPGGARHVALATYPLGTA